MRRNGLRRSGSSPSRARHIADGARTPCSQDTFPLVLRNVDDMLTRHRRGADARDVLPWERNEDRVEPDRGLSLHSSFERKFLLKN